MRWQPGRRAERSLLATGFGAALIAVALSGLAGAPYVRSQGARYVDDDPGCGGRSPCHASIQAAAAAAGPGEEILVLPGRYTETVTVVDRALVLEGPGAGDPDAPDDPAQHALWNGGAGPALTLDARTTDISGTRVSGFRIRSGAGVRLVGRRAAEPDAVPPGLPPSTVDTAVRDAAVSGNLLDGTGSAGDTDAGAIAGLWTDGLLVDGNVVVGGGRIGLEGGSGARIVDNTVAVADGTGIAVTRHDGPELGGNVVTAQKGTGIRLSDVAGGRLSGNTITAGGAGMRVVSTGAAQPGAGTLVIGGSPALGNHFAFSSAPALVLDNASGGSWSADVSATHNHWGTAYASAIEDRIVHRPDDPDLGRVDFLPALGAPAVVDVAAEPPTLVADGRATAVLTATVTDLAGGPVADDALVVFETVGGTVEPAGALVEAESDDVVKTGGWQLVGDGSFGPFSGTGHLRGDPGAELAWTFDGPALIVRYGQTVLGDGGFRVRLDDGAGHVVRSRGSDKRWVDRLVARDLASGPHTLTLTVLTGPISVDLLAVGDTTLGGAAAARLLAPEQVGVGRVTATARGADGARVGELLVPFTPGPPSGLELALGTDVLAVGGMTTTLALDVRDERGRPVADGTAARFSTTHGHVEPEATATIGGRAMAVLSTGSAVGLATVRADVHELTVTRTLTIVPGAPATLEVLPTQSSLPANSTTSTELLVAVHDAWGHAVADGTPVVLSTTLGAVVPEIAFTNGGAVRARLTAGNVAGTAVVRAEAGPARAETSVALVALDMRVTKAVEPLGVVVPGEFVTFTMSYANVGSGTIYDLDLADPLPAGLTSPVLTATGPTLNQRPGEPLAWRVQRMRPGERGVITVELQVDTAWTWPEHTEITNRLIAGSLKAAELTPSDNESAAAVTVVPGAVYTVTLTGPDRLAVGGATGQVSAALTDRFGNRAADGTEVRFSTDFGAVVPMTGTTRGGAARATFTTGTHAGLATVRARSVDENRSDALPIRVVPGPPSRLLTAVGKPTLRVGGDSTVITATLEDQYGNRLAGAPVRFETNLGWISVPEGQTGARGLVTTTLRSGARVGTARVAVRADFLSEFVEVPFMAGPPASIALRLEPPEVLLGEDVRAVVTVTDDHGNPVPGTVVAFSTTAGTVADPVAFTDRDGEALTTIRTNRVGRLPVRVDVAGMNRVAWLTVRSPDLHLPLVVRR